MSFLKTLSIASILFTTQYQIANAQDRIQIGVGAFTNPAGQGTQSNQIRLINFEATSRGEDTIFRLPIQTNIEFGAINGQVNGYDVSQMFVGINKEVLLTFKDLKEANEFFVSVFGGVVYKGKGGNETTTTSDDDVIVNSRLLANIGAKANYSVVQNGRQYVFSLVARHMSNGDLSKTNKGYNMVGVSVKVSVLD